jgi:hypothetical protein
VWEHAKANGFTLVSLDSDFAEMAALSGPPPKVIWLRCGNRPTATVEIRLRGHADAIAGFEQDAGAAWSGSIEPIATCAVAGIETFGLKPDPGQDG